MATTNRRFTKDHEWAAISEEDPQVVVIGISDYAQDHLGDVVMVELPSVGDTLARGDEFGEVESPKSVSAVYAPVSGEVIAVNETLEDEPELINSDCYGAGWMLQIRMGDPAEHGQLMDAETYAAHCEGLDQS